MKQDIANIDPLHHVSYVLFNFFINNFSVHFLGTLYDTIQTAKFLVN